MKQYIVYSDYRGRNGDICKTVQAWTLNMQGTIVEGFGTKKSAKAKAEALGYEVRK